MRVVATKILSLFILCSLFLNLSGCAALKQKFTRKTKAKTGAPVYYQVKKYDIKPSIDLYEKHYIFWINWQRKLVSELGKNFKSDIRSTQEIVSNLEDMATLLTDEKALELEPHINVLGEIKGIVSKSDMTKANETRIRRILENEYRVLQREFSPVKMARYIREEYKVMDNENSGTQSD